MTRNLKRFVMWCFVLTSLGLTACQTMDGAGRDIEDAGQGIQKSAQD